MPSSLWERLPTIRNWLLLAVAVRVALMPLTMSVDGETTAYVATVLAYKGQLILSNDPPPVYYLTAALLEPFRPILANTPVQFFTGNGVYTPSALPQALAATSPGFGVIATIIKIPYLFFDLGIALLLLRLAPSARVAVLALQIWALNPFAIYVSYVVGQYDVIATFFLVLCIYFFIRHRYLASGIALGLATLFQIWPLVVLPIVLIYLGRNTPHARQWARPMLSYVVPVVAGLGALALIYHFQTVSYQSANLALGGDQLDGFYGTVLYNRGTVSQPLVQGITTFLGFTVAFSTMSPLGDMVILVAVVYFAILLFLAYGPRLEPMAVPALASAFLLTYFAFSVFFVQWFLWAQPFVVLVVATDVRRLLPLYLILFIPYLIYSWLFGAPLWGQLLLMVYPPSYYWRSPLLVLNAAGLPGLLLANISRAFLTAVCLFFAYRAYREYVGVRSAAPPDGPRGVVENPPASGAPRAPVEP
ncbi:MAG TPA: hypothetical protein VEJ87_00340 [Acidimicrobiales bacterium]|nr:hypothetical protein [Acidimicrobiales bacterium]